MPSLKKIEVKERLAELKGHHKRIAAHLKPRLQMLILALQKDLHSKYALSTALGADPNSVHAWKTLYAQGGVAALILDKRGGKKKPLIDERTAGAIAQKLADPYAAPRSFTELQAWVDEHFLPGINYHTLRKHVKTKHGAKLKAVRKSHVGKDEAAVAAFKKISRGSPATQKAAPGLCAVQPVCYGRKPLRPADPRPPCPYGQRRQAAVPLSAPL